eukprot:scaffold57781_cov28-Tisochrysis_lutea.AAC.7
MSNRVLDVANVAQSALPGGWRKPGTDAKGARARRMPRHEWPKGRAIRAARTLEGVLPVRARAARMRAVGR